MFGGKSTSSLYFKIWKHRVHGFKLCNNIAQTVSKQPFPSPSPPCLFRYLFLLPVLPRTWCLCSDMSQDRSMLRSGGKSCPLKLPSQLFLSPQLRGKPSGQAATGQKKDGSPIVFSIGLTPNCFPCIRDIHIQDSLVHSSHNS